MSSNLDPRELNRILNIEEHKERRVHLRSRPRYVLVELTQGCNLFCEMCRPNRIRVEERQMSRSLFERVAERLFPTAELVDLRGWGESLVIPDIDEYIETASSYGVAIRFVTNLSFRNPRLLDLLVNRHAYITVSVDTADPNLYCTLRRGGRLDLVRDNITNLVKAYRLRFGSAERITLCCTLQAPTLRQLGTIVTFASEVGITHIILSEISAPLSSPLSLVGHEEDVRNAVEAVIREASLLNVMVSAGTTLCGVLPPPSSALQPCMRYWTHATVSYHGEVGFCDHLIGPLCSRCCLGSLLESEFDEIWNSKAWRSLREQNDCSFPYENDIREECNWCKTNRHLEFEDLLLPGLGEHRFWLYHENDA